MKNLVILLSICFIFLFIIGCGEDEKVNTAPVIYSFQADHTSVKPGEQITLVVSASDEEGDPLTYSYQPEGGYTTGSGNSVTWIAPETAGSYVINVHVSDGRLNTQGSITVNVVPPEPVKLVELKIQWFGHSCFLITSSDGKRVLTDPFNASVGYPVPSVETDVVLVSHSHGDHNNVSVAKGSPKIISSAGQNSAADIDFTGVLSDHDNAGGSTRGKNIIFVWEMDGFRIAHLGDLGQPELTAGQLADIGKVDIVFIPVGGYYTIDATQATSIIGQLSPKLAFPMHYKTDIISSPISSADEFLAGKDNVEKVNSNSFVVKELPEKMKIIVLNYK